MTVNTEDADSFFNVSFRYCIERVFRPRKLDRCHPKELLECAFDIITSTGNSFLPIAETIYAISEIIQEFPVLQVDSLMMLLDFLKIFFTPFPYKILI